MNKIKAIKYRLEITDDPIHNYKRTIEEIYVPKYSLAFNISPKPFTSDPSLNIFILDESYFTHRYLDGEQVTVGQGIDLDKKFVDRLLKFVKEKKELLEKCKNLGFN